MKGVNTLRGMYFFDPPVVLHHDLVADKSSQVSTSLDGNWVGYVLSPTEVVFGIPYGTPNVLMLDISTDIADTTTLQVAQQGCCDYCGGNLGPDNKIYGMACNSNAVLIIDPFALTTDTTSLKTINGSGKWNGGVLANNGNIYGKI